MHRLTIIGVGARSFLTGCLAGIACAALPSGASAADCLKANVADQVVEGRLSVGYAKDAAGRPERPYILKLRVPACLEGTEEDDRVESTGTIHVYPSDDRLHERFQRAVGKSIRVRGNPFAAHTSHHHAPIVMEVVTVEEAGAGRPL